MRRAQAAMEFLMTYGWAILVVLAAIGALAYFGVLSPDRFLPSKCTVGPGFGCTENKATPTTVFWRLKQNIGSDIDLFNVSFPDGTLARFGLATCGDAAADIAEQPDLPWLQVTTDATAANSDDDHYFTNVANQRWVNGAEAGVRIGPVFGGATVGCTFSGKANVDFRISYRIAGESFSHQVLGNVNVRVE